MNTELTRIRSNLNVHNVANWSLTIRRAVGINVMTRAFKRCSSRAALRNSRLTALAAQPATVPLPLQFAVACAFLSALRRLASLANALLGSSAP
jgi:hypothetical protein